MPTRRQLMKMLAVGLGAGLGGCASTRSSGDVVASAPRGIPGGSAVPLRPRAQESSPAGEELALRLWSEEASVDIVAGGPTSVLSYGAEVVAGNPAAVQEGPSYLGPTLRVQSGQRLRVRYENRMSAASIVHWHGLDVPESQDGQPADVVGQGEAYEYDFVVANGPGTYWYHPHPHGRTGEQVYRGLAGLVIVEGDEPGLPDGDNDLPLVLQDRSFAADGSLRYVRDRHSLHAGFVGDQLCANGMVEPVIPVRPEPYRLRILNGANARIQHLRWSSGAPITAVAADGVGLREARDLPALVLTPGQRTDVWVDFSAHLPGDRLQLLSAETFVDVPPRGRGKRRGAQASALALEHVPAVTFAVGLGLPWPGTRPTGAGPEPGFGADDAVNSRTPKEFVLTERQGVHLINGRRWEGRAASQRETVTAGTVELWEFVNRSPVAHPMHLHGRHFRVVQRRWEDRVATAAWEEIAPGVLDEGLHDTVLVWPGQRVRIAVQFSEHLGYFPYHCHTLEHEDAGMMRNFRVVPRR